MKKGEIRDWLVRRLSEQLGIPQDSIDQRQPLAWYGLGSAQVVALSGELEGLLGRRVPPAVVFEHPSIDALSRFLSGEHVAARDEAGAAAEQEPIAIVGIGCRFPGAHGPAAFWRLISGGTDAIREVPPDRWDAAAYYDADQAAPGKSVTRWGGFLEAIDRFDAHFFGIAPAEATRMDPQQRLLLEVAWEALEDAGLVPERLAGSSTGAFVGISTNEYARLFTNTAELDARAATGTALSIAANRLSYAFDFRGPSVALDTACSSSLVAVHLACRSLRSGETSLALAGGVSLMLTPLPSISFSKAGIMSPDGRCKTFDASANGYVRGEGAGMVVLKRLSRAIADRDPIYAVIRGTAVNQDGRSNGLMAPNPAAQEAVLRAAHRDAGVMAADVQYVEAHGTGTYLGDPIEAKALGSVLSPGRKSPCALGSVKTNIGHLEAAAGVAGLIKVALSLKNSAIPASLHYKQPNPQIAFDALGLKVQTTLEPWPEGPGGKLAGVSSFGFGGSNAHAILAAPPPVPELSAGDSPRPELLVLTAMSEASLAAVAREHALALKNGASPTDLAHTAALHRTHHRHRVALAGFTGDELAGKLEAFARGTRAVGVVAAAAPSRPRKLAFIFSGQASQWAGMGERLYENEPEARQAIDRVEEIVRAFAGWSVIDVLTDPDPARMKQTEFAQPAIFAIQIGLAALWRSWGVTPDAVVGHSVGEIAAAHVAGALSLERAVRLVIDRARLMQEAGGGEMAAVGLSAKETAVRIERFGGRLSIAAHNAPEVTVVAGDRDCLEELLDGLDVEGIYTRALRLGYAFHSADMDPVQAPLHGALEGLEPFEASIPFYSTVTGTVLGGAALDRGYWLRNVRQPVLFQQAVEALIGDGFELFVELGGEPVHARAVRAILEHRGAAGEVLPSLKKLEDPAAPLPYSALAALFACGQWVNFTSLYGQRGQRTSGLPPYAFDRARFWLDEAPREEPRVESSVHPLLGARVQVAPRDGLELWPGKICGKIAPFLADHTVRGVPVFPATAYVELALAAAAELAPDAESLVLERISIEEVLLLDDDARELQVTAESAASDEDVELAIHSRRAGARWVRHARAKLGKAEAAIELADIPTLRARIAEPVDLEALYGALDAVGLTYGPAFRGVSEVFRSEDEALGRVKLPEVLVREAGRYRAHPAFLDACLHVLGVLRLEGGAEALHLPSTIDAVRLLDPLPQELWSHARVVSEDETGFTGDVRLYDDRGRLVLEVRGLRMRRVSAGGERPVHLYRLDWRVKPRAKPRTGEPAGTWVIVPDREGTAAAFAEALEARGGRAIIAPDDARLLEEAVTREAEGGALSGVLHFASAEQAASGLRGQELFAAQERWLAAISAICRGLQRAPAARLGVITRGAQHVIEGERVAIAAAPLWGMVRSLFIELPDARPFLLDLGSSGGTAETEVLLELLLAKGDEHQLALRHDQLFVPRLLRHAGRAFAAMMTSSGVQASLRSDASYLITGGLGGLGGLVAERLVERGAKHLWLIGRSAPRPDGLALMKRLLEAGVQVRFARADVSDREALENALRSMSIGGPPLAGIIHAAGVIDDGPVTALRTPQISAVLAPKVRGAWNLHELTRKQPLDFFVLFSSAASILGSPWQSSYAAANAFLDQLAHERRAQGLAALSISWGPWAEVGMAAQTLERQKTVNRTSMHLNQLIPPPRGLDLLEGLMQESGASYLALPVDAKLLAKLYPRSGGAALFSELRGAQAPAKSTAEPRLHPRPPLAQPYVEPRDEVEWAIAGLWQAALTLETVGVQDDFFELGGDSLFAGQIISQLNRRYGVSIGFEEAFRSLTIEKLAEVVRSKRAS